MGIGEELAQMESPFLSKSGTSFAPSPKEILGAQEMLLDNHHTPLDPIRRVPADILRGIFVQCLPEDQLPTHNIHQAPLLLTGICRSWREVVVTTPCLWNRIHISLSYPPIPPITDSFRSLMKASVKGLEIWLERSGTMPLTVSLFTDTPSGPFWSSNECKEIEDLYIDFARHLLPYASRWKSLSTTISAYVMVFLMVLPESCELTSLEEFKPTRQPEAQIYWDMLVVLFRCAPSLHSVQLHKACLDKLAIRWGNLTEVVLSRSPLENVLPCHAMRVLSLSCSSIRHFTLYLKLDETTVSSVETPVVLPFLHTLKVQIGSSGIPMTALALQHLFDALTAPMLKTLHIASTDSNSRDDYLDTLPFLLFLERSGCALSSFALDLPVKATGLIELLRLAPSLVELTLRGNALPKTNAPLGEFFDALTPTHVHPDVLCPRLESLICMRCPELAADPLLALAKAKSSVESQYPSVQRLKRLRVDLRDFDEERGHGIPVKLKSLREQGMTVQWSSTLYLGNQFSDTLESWRGGLDILNNWESVPFNAIFY